MVVWWICCSVTTCAPLSRSFLSYDDLLLMWSLVYGDMNYNEGKYFNDTLGSFDSKLESARNPHTFEGCSAVRRFGICIMFAAAYVNLVV